MTLKRAFLSVAATTALVAAAHVVPAQALTVTASTPSYGTIDPGKLYVYETSSSVPAASGSLSVGSGIGTNGGVCAPNVGGSGVPCGSYTYNTPTQAQGLLVSGSGNTSAGQIEIMTPGALGYPENYALVVTLAILNGKGDIYNLVVNGATALGGISGPGGCAPQSNGGSTSTTSPISSAGLSGGGTFCSLISASATPSPVYLSVTDLTEQWNGVSPYTLPTLLGGATNGADLGSPGNTSSTFTLFATFTPAPEPGTLSVLFAGSAALGLARRRRARTRAAA